MSLYHQLSSGPGESLACNLTDIKLFEMPIWSNDYICHLKSQLYELCLQLEDKDSQEWSRHTNKMEESSWILPTVRNTVDPELLTRAWLKMREILGKFDLLAGLRPGQSVNGLFLCEAPGAFVSSVNHWIQEKEPNCHFNWKACTLNPYHESLESSFAIFDDRLYKFTHDNWILSPHDNTGSIMHVDFLPFLRETLESNFQGHKASFVTADGGVSCVNDPENQETKLAPLIFTEMILALDSLQAGGFFVLKTFSLFHCNSLCLCYYLSRVFDSVHMAKPITSKAGNSEVYLVCIGFRGLLPEIHQQLVSLVTSGCLLNSLSSKCMFAREHIPLEFILNFQQGITLLNYKQRKAIDQNLSRFKVDLKELESDLILIKKRTCRKFFHLNKISKIPLEKRLVKGSNIGSASKDAFSYFLCHPVEKVRVAFKNFINYLKVLESVAYCQGSLKDRRASNSLTTPCYRHLIDSICQQDRTQVGPIFSQWHLATCERKQFDESKIVSAPQLESIIYNSKFVSPSLLNLFKQIQSIGQYFENVECTNMDRQFDELLLNLLGQVTQSSPKINVISSGKGQISSHLIDILSAISPEKKVFPQKQVDTSSPTLYIRHVTSSPSTVTATSKESFVNSNFTSNSTSAESASTSNSTSVSCTNHLHPLAMDQFLDLLEWIEFTLKNNFTERDLLAVSVDHSLDRLTVGLMFLLCKSFSFYTILPRSGNWFNPKTIPGHIFIFTLPSHSKTTGVMSSNTCNDRHQDHHPDQNNSGNGSGYSCHTEDHLTHKSNDHLHDISSHFTQLKATVSQHLQTQHMNPTKILELVPVPQILQGGLTYSAKCLASAIFIQFFLPFC